MTAEEWVFGIDGGGTRSRIRVESLAGSLVLEESGGPMNPNSSPPGRVDVVLAGLLKSVLSAGLDARLCRAGLIGSAGVDRPEDRAAMTDRLSAAFRAAAKSPGGSDADSPVFAAKNDAEPALVGVLGDMEGFLLIAGTGSIAYGRSRSGLCVRSGGWGHVLGDEGSAFWIALEAVKRGLRSSEGREEPSRLLDAALAFFGADRALDLLPLAYDAFDKARIASFAPRVANLAAEGDRAAGSIMAEAARELASLAVSVFQMLESEGVRRRLAFHGGLIENNPALRSDVARRLSERVPGLEIVEPAGDPASGACRMARSLLERDS